MPTSNPDNIGFIIKKIMETEPKKVLDVGVGFGKMGMLCREYLEIWMKKALLKKDWQTQIDGMEIFEGYVNPIYSFAYDKVWLGETHGDVMKNLDKLKDYDLVLLIDVIEHLTKDEGKILLDAIPNHYIVSTPALFSKQGKEYGNPHEEHKSWWADFDWPNKAIGSWQVISWK